MMTGTWSSAMHAALDGEASAAEVAALDERLAGDPVARREFAALEKLFGELAAVDTPHPPEGLVAAVTASLREYSRHDQLRASAGVLGSTDRKPARGGAPFTPSAFSFSSAWEFFMDQQSNSLFSNRKAVVGGGIAVVAVAVALAFGMSGTPRNQDINGTIVAAERYRAPQTTTDQVQLGDMSVAQLLQNDAFLKIVKDPQVQSLMVEPDFEPGAQLIVDNPEAVRRALAGQPDPQFAAGFRALQAHPEAARMLLATPQASYAILHNMQASQSFIPVAERNHMQAENAATAARMGVAMSTPNAASAATAASTPTANFNAAAMSTPNAQATPNAMSAPNALSTPNAQATPSALGTPNAQLAPNAMSAPSALSAPAASSQATAQNAATASRMPTALSAPNASSAATAQSAATASRQPAAQSAATANSAPAASRSTQQ